MKLFKTILPFITFGCFLVVRKIDCSTTTNNNKDVNVDTLKLVILIHRHGDRTPIEMYPRDPFRNITKYWPDGVGQLTLSGKKRMYKLGQYLSRRYKNFLGESPHEVYIRSSGSDRCLESTSLLLAGLYPPEGRWKWNKDLGQKWQPFPIQTVPHDNDGMLNPGSKCKQAEQIIKDIYRSPKVLQYYNEVKPTLLYVQDNTGYENVDLIKAEEIFDSLLIEKMANLKLPAWVDHNVYEKLKDISAKTFIFSGMTKQIQRFRSGLLLSEIWQHISNRPTSNENKRLYIYSTHDTQLSVFLSAINEFNGMAPPFGASIMIELHQNQKQEPFLKIYYLNVTEMEQPYLLELKDCQKQQTNHQCTISKFYETIKDLIPNDWQLECQNPTSSGTSDPLSIYLVFTTIALTISVMFFFIYLLLNNRRHGSLYRLLPVN